MALKIRLAGGLKNITPEKRSAKFPFRIPSTTPKRPEDPIYFNWTSTEVFVLKPHLAVALKAPLKNVWFPFSKNKNKKSFIQIHLIVMFWNLNVVVMHLVINQEFLG